MSPLNANLALLLFLAWCLFGAVYQLATYTRNRGGSY